MIQKTLLLILALLLAAIGVGVALLMQQGPQELETGLAGPGRVDAPLTAAPEEAAVERAPRGLTDEELERAGELANTVVLPLKLEFELVASVGKLSAPGAEPMGSDATARIRGSAHTATGTGLAGEARFVAGPNEGRVLELDEGGRFGANDLYPGLSLVHITGRGVPGALREVLLREDREAQLNVGFGRPAVVFGQVFDRKNNFVEGAKVVMDGQETITDDRGVFQFVRMTSGKVPVFISKHGFADTRSVEYITAGSTLALGKLRYVLDESASLRISLPERVGTGAPAQVILSRPLEASFAGRERKFPWHLKNPIRLYAGESVDVDGLPPGRLRIQVFQPGAIVEPSSQEVTLVAGGSKAEVFHLTPAPTLSGRVLFNGQPADRALVQLEAPDLTGATIGARGGTLGRAQVELDLFGHAPSARQTVLTGADGRFELSANEELSAVRYLTARSADGRSWAGIAVKKGQYEVDLELAVEQESRAKLTIETSTRFQALPVLYTIDGEPHQALLPPGERLELEDLPAGSWRYSARWGNEVIQAPTSIEVDGELDLFVPLPEGAVQGQSKRMRDSMQVPNAGAVRRG